MNETPSAIECSKCHTRFRVKPGMLKLAKTIRCSKCGFQIPVPNATATTTSPAPAPEPPPPIIQTPDLPTTESATTVTPNGAEESALAAAEKKISALLANIETLTTRLRSLEQELAESDARITSLQELWHGKELEVREMSNRVSRAEKEARAALAMRDEFLARAKNELAAYLVGERDSALSRFSDLQKRLLGIEPGHRAD